MKKWLLATVFGLTLVLGACGGGNNADDNAANEGTATDENEGTTETAGAEDIYKSNCASCHGGDLSGGVGPALENIGSKYSADEIADIIENGTGSMQPQKQVQPEDRETLANWLAEKQ